MVKSRFNNFTHRLAVCVIMALNGILSDGLKRVKKRSKTHRDFIFDLCCGLFAFHLSFNEEEFHAANQKCKSECWKYRLAVPTST